MEWQSPHCWGPEAWTVESLGGESTVQGLSEFRQEVVDRESAMETTTLSGWFLFAVGMAVFILLAIQLFVIAPAIGEIRKGLIWLTSQIYL